jgi:ribosomal protein S18 acetylase RimI-like enzyme
VDAAQKRPLVSLIPWTNRRDDVFRVEVSEIQRAFISGQSVAEFLADDDDHPTFASYAICHESAIVGMVCLGREPDHEPGESWIPLLVIDLQHQGQGYARAAMERVIADLKDRGECRSLGLSCAPDNSAAISLYESLGFQRGRTNSKGELELWLAFNRA